jgi:hypothetical protein
MVIDDPEKMHVLTADMKKQIIQAATTTVNMTARLAQKEAKKNLEDNFILRNTFSARQVQFTPMAESPYIKLSAIQSIVGVTRQAPWLVRQEEGGEHTPSQGRTLAISTDVARGGSVRKPIQQKLRVGSIKKKHRVHGKASRNHASQADWFVSRAFVAFQKDLFLPMGGTDDQRNLHEVVSFQPIGTGEHREVKIETQQIYKFDLEKTRTKAQPWLEPACEKVAKDIPNIFVSQMKKLGL